MSGWDFACPDWWDRLKSGSRPWADLPLDLEAAEKAVGIFDFLKLPDVIGQPRLSEAAGDWFRDIVRAAFGSTETSTGVRMIGEIFALVPKKNSKTTYTAGLGLTALLLNKQPNAAMQIVGPTKEIAATCFDQMVGMINADDEDPETGRPYLAARFHVIDNKQTIKCRVTGAVLKVKTFDMSVVTGSIPVLTIIDEIHLLAKVAYASRVIAQIRGGMLAKPDALLIFITTQADEVPAGVFKTELEYARAVRDGIETEKVKTLPILYEFPEEVQQDEKEPWKDPKLWHIVTPNLGKSIALEGLETLYQKALAKGNEEVQTWASQHLNIQVGMGAFADRWTGSKLWMPGGKTALSFDAILKTSDCITAGIDGGGLDDLLGLCLIGRHRVTKQWQSWSKAWVHPEALEARKENVERMRDFEKDNDLVICQHGTQDLEEISQILSTVHQAGLFPEAYGIGVDPMGITALVDELALAGLLPPLIAQVRQGASLSPAVWGAERKLKDGTLAHCNQPMMNWCVSNARTEQRGNAVMITKAISGKAKIDPLIAFLCAFVLMSRNPIAQGNQSSPWDDPEFSIRAA